MEAVEQLTLEEHIAPVWYYIVTMLHHRGFDVRELPSSCVAKMSRRHGRGRGYATKMAGEGGAWWDEVAVAARIDVDDDDGEGVGRGEEDNDEDDDHRGTGGRAADDEPGTGGRGRRGGPDGDATFPCDTLPRLDGAIERPLVFSRGIATLVVRHARDTRDILLVFSLAQCAGVDLTRSVVGHMQQTRSRHGILFSGNGVTPPAEKELSALPTGLRLEIFEYSFFSHCVVRHSAVPRHVVLTPEEAAALMKRRGLDPRALPGESPHSPISRYYGLVVGDVILYERRNGTQETHSLLRVIR
jgi:DNA-directed RNA polymerases I, II, and III subunit RPABC1